MAHGGRSCEKINNLTQRRKGAKTRKEQLLFFFAPLREMLLLFQGFFHSFGSRGEAVVVNSSARVSGRQSRLEPPIIYVAPAGATAMGHILPPLGGLPPLALFPNGVPRPAE
jgi:hypothetical protein